MLDGRSAEERGRQSLWRAVRGECGCPKIKAESFFSSGGLTRPPIKW